MLCNILELIYTFVMPITHIFKKPSKYVRWDGITDFAYKSATDQIYGMIALTVIGHLSMHDFTMWINIIPTKRQGHIVRFSKNWTSRPVNMTSLLHDVTVTRVISHRHLRQTMENSVSRVEGRYILFVLSAMRRF
jgi:hypothetical protein